MLAKRPYASSFPNIWLLFSGVVLSEMKPGQFGVQRHGSNAFVTLKMRRAGKLWNRMSPAVVIREKRELSIIIRFPPNFSESFPPGIEKSPQPRLNTVEMMPSCIVV